MECPPPLGTQCPGETTSLSLLAGTAASGSFRRPISQSRHHGNGSWRAGWLACPGPPSRRPLPRGGVRGGGRAAEKSAAPSPFPLEEERARVQGPQGPFIPGCGGSPAPSPGAYPRRCTGCVPSGTLFLEASLWEPSRVPSLRRAHSPRGRGTPHPHRGPCPPASALPGCTPFSPSRAHSGPGMAPPRPLCPRQQGSGGRKRRGKGRKRQPGGPRRDWRG